MMLEDFLDSLGHRVVASVDSVEDALARVEEGGFDLAIVDVRVKEGKTIWPVADRLASSGIPFILATGGHVDPPPAEHAAAPLLAKPYTMDAVEPLINACFSGETPTQAS